MKFRPLITYPLTALRTNAPRLQRRELVHSDLRQPARLLHLERARPGGSRRIGWWRDVSILLVLTCHTTYVRSPFQLGIIARSGSTSDQVRTGPVESVRRDQGHSRPGGADHHRRLSSARSCHAGLPPARLCPSRAYLLGSLCRR